MIYDMVWYMIYICYVLMYDMIYGMYDIVWYNV